MRLYNFNMSYASKVESLSKLIITLILAFGDHWNLASTEEKLVGKSTHIWVFTHLPSPIKSLVTALLRCINSGEYTWTIYRYLEKIEQLFETYIWFITITFLSTIRYLALHHSKLISNDHSCPAQILFVNVWYLLTKFGYMAQLG